MHAIETDISTPEASRFLQQLCKHWSHRLNVTFTPDEGRVAFSESVVCLMRAAPDTLSLRIEAPTAEETTRMAGVVIDHLQRFAFREPLAVPDWRQT